MIKEKFNKIKELIVKNKKKTVMYSLVFLAVVSTVTTSTLLILQNNKSKSVNSLNNSSELISSSNSDIETSSEDNISSSEVSYNEISSNAESQNNSSNYPGNSSENKPQNNNVTSSKVSNTQTQNKPTTNNNTNKPQNNTNNTSSKNNVVQNQAPTNQRTWQYMESLSKETFNLMNQFRQQYGVTPLKWNETCNARAKKQAKYNAETNTFGHGLGQISLGNDIGTAQSFINQWANSPGHKASMLRETDTDGAVSVYRDSTGAYFVVADKTNDFWG